MRVDANRLGFKLNLTGRARSGETAPGCGNADYTIGAGTTSISRRELLKLIRWRRGGRPEGGRPAEPVKKSRRDSFARSSGLLKRVMALPSSFEDTCKSW